MNQEESSLKGFQIFSIRMAEGGIGCTDSESETGSVFRQSSLHNRHTLNHVESVSVEICTIMTRLGYGEEIRRWRIKKYKELDMLTNKGQRDVTIITAGSKAEGLTRRFESDWDSLYVLNSAICVEVGMNLHTIPDDIDLFRMDTGVYPGHCRLLQQRQGSRRCIALLNALCGNGYGDVLLSSSLFLNELATLTPTFEQHSVRVKHEPAGPSLPHTTSGLLHTYTVFALRCHCPSVLQIWATRPRHWPPPVIVQKVVSLGAYVTAVGSKESEYKHMEWRICFNTGEAELVNNLNDTQTKVYVILKMILKDILKPNNKEITSYILKNIVLWQGERNPQILFRAYNLFHWLQDGLRELRTAIIKKHLPYYMIPERNLMQACGIKDVMQRKWVADITDMLEEGPGVILRLEKIRKAIIASPEPMLWFSKKRMELEMLQLEGCIRCIQCRDENGMVDDSDFILDMISRRVDEICSEVLKRMFLDHSIVNHQYILREILK